MLDIALLLWWLIVLVFLSLTSAFVLATSLQVRNDILSAYKYANIPVMKIFPFLTHYRFISFLYSQKYPRAALLQIWCAICKLFERERIVLMWSIHRPIVLFYRPEKVKVLLNSSSNITKSTEYDFLKTWLGTGLLTSDGNKWRTHRKLLTPAFHFEILENFLNLFNDQAAILTQKLELEVEKSWIDIVPPITMCTLDIICETAMGVHLNTQSGNCKEYVHAVSEVSDIFVYRALRPWLWNDFLFLNVFPSGSLFRKNLKHIHDFIKKVIKEKKEFMLRKKWEGKEELIPKKPKKKALLELLLEHHLQDESLTEEHIKEEVDTFMFEGHDTTAMSLSWTLYELGRHPKIQEKVFQELDDIFGYDRDRDVTAEDLKELKYLECVIKETLRLYPPVAFFGRKITENLEIDDCTLIPDGCTCLVSTMMLHRDPEQFPNPEVFDPDRFLPENSTRRHQYAYVPFSAGPRNCIGQRFALMEEKTVLAHILRKFRLTSLDPRDRIEILAGLVLKNAEPIRIKFSLREKDNL